MNYCEVFSVTNSISGVSSWFNPDWFERKDFYLIPKEEYRTEIAEALSRKKQHDMERLSSFLEDVRKNGNGVSLTDEQWDYLSKTYDPSSMDKEDYQRLIDDLCSFGALQESDKPYLSCGYGEGLDLRPLDLSEPCCEISPYAPGRPMDPFFSGRGNVLEWARFRASFEYFDSGSQSFQKSRSAILFGRLEEVLEQIAG